MLSLLLLFVVILLLSAFIGLMISNIKFENADARVASLRNGGRPTAHALHGVIDNPTIIYPSDDSGGSLIGTLTGPGTFEISVTFEKPFSFVPKSVVLTPATPHTGIPLDGYLLTVDVITNAGFEVIGYTPSSLPNGVLFYYMIL